MLSLPLGAEFNLKETPGLVHDLLSDDLSKSDTARDHVLPMPEQMFHGDS